MVIAWMARALWKSSGTNARHDATKSWSPIVPSLYMPADAGSDEKENEEDEDPLKPPLPPPPPAAAPPPPLLLPPPFWALSRRRSTISWKAIFAAASVMRP